MQTAVSRRLAALEAQRKARHDVLVRSYFDAVELALGADYDRWLELAAGGLAAIRPALAEWRGYSARIEASPAAKIAELELIAFAPEGWMDDSQIEVCDALNS